MNKLGLSLALITLASAGCAAPTVQEPEQAPSLAISWTAEPGQQVQHCVRLSVTETTFVASIDTLTPPGTERITVWHAEPGNAADACPEVDARGLLFDGLEPLQLPTGVALRVPVGQELWLRADVINDTDAPLSGTSGVFLMTDDQAHTLADVVSLSADIANDDICEMPADSFVFAVASDVANSAHMELTAHSSFAGGDVLLYEGSASEGAQALTQPVALRAGEQLEVSCTPSDGVFTNATAGVPAVDPAAACHAAVYRFPATTVGCR